MSDIERLRENVINAARAIKVGGKGYAMADVYQVVDAVDALDAALTPDPWDLLRAAYDWMMSDAPQTNRSSEIEAALEWREANP